MLVERRAVGVVNVLPGITAVIVVIIVVIVDGIELFSSCESQCLDVNEHKEELIVFSDGDDISVDALWRTCHVDTVAIEHRAIR